MIRRILIVAVLGSAALATGCSAAVTPPASVAPSTGADTTVPLVTGKSLIVASMENSYEERPELPIDSCQDSFIATMKSLGYELSSTVEPNTFWSYGYWHTACIYRSEFSSMTIGTTNSPNLAEYLNPGSGAFTDPHQISIGERFAVAAPMDEGHRGCFIGMETSFGAIDVTGGVRGVPKVEGRDKCEAMKEFLEQLEPLLGD